MKTTVQPIDNSDPVIVMTRIFDAPREVVWVALTDPKHVVHWYGGHGFQNPVCEMDVRPGGRWRHVMRTPDGAEHSMEFVFVEVVRPEKLVWRSASHGTLTGGGPHDNITTVTLEEEGQRTRWTLETRFHSVADRDTARRIGFTSVLSEGTDKLADVLRELTS